MSELEELVEKYGIRIEPQLVSAPRKGADKDDWRANSYHWHVVLKWRDAVISTDFWQGSGHAKKTPFGMKATPPTAASVLSCLCSDAGACDVTFDDWCVDLGENNDSIRARDTYHECQRIGKKLKAFLGTAYDEIRNAQH